MHCPGLGERAIAVEVDFVARANVALKGGRPGERAAERSARIRDCILVDILQRGEIDRCSVSPPERRLLDQFAVTPGSPGLDAEAARDAGHQRGLNAADPVVAAIDGRYHG